MQLFGDLISSIKGEINARNKDPIMGTFSLIWITCNWDKLATIIWGAKPFDDRIQDLRESLSIFNFWNDWRLIILPIILSVFFLFVLPWISLLVKQVQRTVILIQHTHSVDVDVSKVVEQKKLRKAALRADPEKEFLAEEVRMDLQEEQHRNDRRNKILEYIKAKADAANALSTENKNRAETTEIELVQKRRQAEVEALRFKAQTAMHQETLASSRFPIVYELMERLDQSLRADSITLSLGGLSSIISTIFGYDDAKAVMDDRAFSREGISKIKYLYFDLTSLAQKLEEIAEKERFFEDDHISSEILFGHLQEVLAEFDLKFLSGDALAEDISERVAVDAYELLHSDELSGPMAETDTAFDEIEIGLDSYDFSTSFNVTLTGSASGSHRKESGVPGRSLDVSVVAKCVPKLGKFGLEDYKLEISGSPEDYH